jgi:general secretion pathway protein E/type IV pilus assembly protein PilB
MVLQLARRKELLSEEQLLEVQSQVSVNGESRAGAAGGLSRLTDVGVLSADQLADLIAEVAGCRRVRLTPETLIPAELLALVPQAVAARYGALPISRDGPSLCVATSDPWATDRMDNIAHVTGLPVDVVVTTAEEILSAIERCYGRASPVFGDPEIDLKMPEPSFSAREPAAVATDEETDDADAPVVRLVQSIILRAVQQRASDIHLEPLEGRFRVRFRIDGVLCEVDSPPKRLQLAIISRVKIMANISIAEKRLPQDGRIQIALGDRALDLRVSTLPTAHGESIVMRILDAEGMRIGLSELGMGGELRRDLERLIARPDGIVLVTGPTGSGKTTTLYACLHALNQSNRKIITVEDPVEYQLSGINQVPVRPGVGLTFAAALRAILRQAPNVVMIGEIRDLETAEIAIQASLTGHLVFSTLHTNDAPSAVTRLLDLGVKPFLVGASLRGVLAQRLVRKTCEKCRVPYAPEERELRALGCSSDERKAGSFRRGLGCPSCRGAGYRGRTGIFELLAPETGHLEMIHARASAARLRQHARALGMRTMREDGVAKAIAGLTTVEEVVSITVGDSS